MTKNELVEFIAAKAGLTKADANRALEATLEGIQTGLKNVHCALQKVPFSYFLTSSAIYSRLCIQLAYFAPADFPAAAQYFPAGTPDQPFHPRHPSGPAPPERSSR